MACDNLMNNCFDDLLNDRTVIVKQQTGRNAFESSIPLYVLQSMKDGIPKYAEIEPPQTPEYNDVLVSIKHSTSFIRSASQIRSYIDGNGDKFYLVSSYDYSLSLFDANWDFIRTVVDYTAVNTTNGTRYIDSFDVNFALNLIVVVNRVRNMIIAYDLDTGIRRWTFGVYASVGDPSAGRTYNPNDVIITESGKILVSQLNGRITNPDLTLSNQNTGVVYELNIADGTLIKEHLGYYTGGTGMARTGEVFSPRALFYHEATSTLFVATGRQSVTSWTYDNATNTFTNEDSYQRPSESDIGTLDITSIFVDDSKVYGFDGTTDKFIILDRQTHDFIGMIGRYSNETMNNEQHLFNGLKHIRGFIVEGDYIIGADYLNQQIVRFHINAFETIQYAMPIGINEIIHASVDVDITGNISVCKGDEHPTLHLMYR